MTDPLAIALPPDLLDEIARRVATILAANTTTPDAWLDVEGAAAHLAVPKSRIYDLSSRSRYPADHDAFPVHKDGSRSYFKSGELDAWRSALDDVGAV